MRVVIQRVLESSVTIDGHRVAEIGHGLMVLVGIEQGDAHDDADWLAGKIARMRVFSDAEGKMNLPVAEAGGELLAISQFTLHASTRKGNRPSFLQAAAPERSEPLYNHFCEALAAASGLPVARGVFGADMKVALINDGPVTILMDSRARE